MTATRESAAGTDVMAGRRGFLGGLLAGVGAVASVGTVSAQRTADERTLDIVGTGSVAEYEVSVTGEFTSGGADPNDSTDGSQASGAVNNYTDTYTFTGEIVGIRIDGDADLFVDDSPTTAAELNGTADSTTETASTAPRGFGGSVHLSDGDDLGQQVRDALADGQSSIHVHPHASGSGWSWGTDVTHNTKQGGPFELIVHDTVEIDYTGDTRPLTVTTGGEAADDNAFRLVGGTWTASGSPTEWLRVDDQIGYHVAPRMVDWPDEEQATALEVRNVGGYSELGIIEGTYKCGNGIDFVPASETGGDGTDSFQGTTIDSVRINVHADGGFGIRPQGVFTYCLIERPNIFATVASDVDAIRYGTSGGAPAALGTTVTSLQAEAVGDAPNMTALACEDSYNSWYAPLHINPKAGGGASGTDGETYAAVVAEADSIRLGDWGGSELVYDYADDTLRFGDASVGLRASNGELVAVGPDGSETTLTE